MSKKVVIAGACRTAIGKMGGALSTTPAPVLGSIVIKEALNRAGVPADQVDHVYMGCVIQAGLGQNVARQAALKAGLPIETPAVTVNVVCGSGLNWSFAPSGCSVKLYFHSRGVIVYSGCTCAPQVLSPPKNHTKRRPIQTVDKNNK